MKCWNLAVIDCVESAKTGEGLLLCYIRAQVWRPNITCMGRDWAESSQVCHRLHYERETRKVSQCGNTICRRWSLERKLADAEVTEEEQNDLLKDLERRETEYMRLQRHKMGVDDFELLTIIGRGAFGEVLLPFFDWAKIFFHCPFSSSVPNLLIIAIVLDITSQVLVMFYTLLDFLIPLLWDFVIMQVRLCREKVSGQVYAMKKLKKSEMLRRGQVDVLYG